MITRLAQIHQAFQRQQRIIWIIQRHQHQRLVQRLTQHGDKVKQSRYQRMIRKRIQHKVE